MERNSTRIHRYDLLYKLLKASNSFAFHLFYRRIEVKGRENIDRKNAIIFTPNHQNALMDALAVLFTGGMDVIFMARADIFRKKRQAKILNFLKILPIYRQRDGSEELSRNEEIFDLAKVVLNDKSPVCIMPEGNHGSQRKLRPLVKGTFRIALNCQQTSGDELRVQIIPVGIDYEHYQKFYQDLLIIYGKPIEMKDFIGQYSENPPRAINQLKEVLGEEMKKVMIHIESSEYYDMYQEIREIYNSRMRTRIGLLNNTHFNRFMADKESIRVMDDNLLRDPAGMNSLSEKVKIYSEGLKKFNFRNWVIDRKGLRSYEKIFLALILAAGFPLFLFGWINNLIPWLIPQRAIRNIKDPQFHSSFKFVVAFLLFPVYYIVMAVIIGLISGSAIAAMVYIPSGLLSGAFALHYSFWFKKLRSSLLFSRKNPEKDRLVDLHSEIINYMNRITEEYQKRYKPEFKKNLNVL